MVSGLKPKCRAVSRTFRSCSSYHLMIAIRRLASSLGSAGSLAKRAAPGSIALCALIETPAYRPFIHSAGVRYLSDPNQACDLPGDASGTGGGAGANFG